MSNERIGQRQMRTLDVKFETREDKKEGTEETEKRIEGYFSVFDGVYQIADGITERIDPHAFDDTINGDIRALTDHDTTLVLGRTTANTLSLKTDAHGLWGSILINPKDQDAINLYERVKRGDVNQCSFGFDIIEENSEVFPDGAVQWTIMRVKLYEVSVCTFPAYETTAVSARQSQAEEIRKRVMDSWREKERAKHPWLVKDQEEKQEEDDGTQGTND